MRRRKFLQATMLATGLTALRWNSLEKLSPAYKIALHPWLGPQSCDEIKNHYFQKIPFGGFHFETVSALPSPNELFDRGFDALVASPSCYDWLNKEVAFFGNLPFGLEGEQKIKWLLSPESQRLQREFFAPLNIAPSLVGLMPERMGFFSKSPINSIADFKGKSMAASGVRAHWLKKQGLKTEGLSPYDQAMKLNRGELDLSDIYPSGLSYYIGRMLDGSHQYTLFPKIRSAPTLMVMWNKKAWGRVQSANPQLEKISQNAFFEVTRSLREQEKIDFAKVKQRFSIQTLSDDVVNCFYQDALNYRNLISQRGAYSRKLSMEYAKYV